MIRPSMKLALLAVPLAVAWLMPGCGLQGQGQLCSTLTNVNGVSSDCDQTAELQLTCAPKSGLGQDVGVCCPAQSGMKGAVECGDTWHPYDYDAGVTTTGGAGGGASTSSGSTGSSTGSVSASSSATTGSTSSGSTSSGAGGSASSTSSGSGSSTASGGM